MATYNGVILTNDDTSGVVLKKVYTDVEYIRVVQDDMEILKLQTTVHDGEQVYPFLFLLGENGEIELPSIKKNIFQGHTTWGDDNERPRRYPLEISWTKKKS